MARIEFEADTLEQLVDMARQWVAGYAPTGPPPAAAAPPQGPQPEELPDVLTRIVSPTSRAFMRAVAERSVKGGVLVVDEELLAGLGVADEKAFVGVRGVANRTMRRRAHRDLVTWDPARHGYRMDREDALVALDVLGTDEGGPAPKGPA